MKEPTTESYLEVLFSPAEFRALRDRDLSGTSCVVFDVLRATSSMVSALANGAESILPVDEIEEALQERRRNPAVMLAGERNGVRIHAGLTGSIPFDFGNSPREFLRENIRGKSLAMTTTNGTRALRACSRAKSVLVGSFLNLRTTADFLLKNGVTDLLIICSGTHEHAAYEDALAAGALCDQVWDAFSQGVIADSALMVRRLFLSASKDLVGAMGQGENGRRLCGISELQGDLAFCGQVDRFPLVAEIGADDRVRRQAG